MHNSFQLDVEAPPETVFEWLGDPERFMQWAKGVVENEPLEETPDKVGSTFRQVYEERGRKMEFQGRVTAWEDNRRLGIAMTSSCFDLDVDYTLEPTPQGTRLTQDSEVTFKGFMRFVAPLMAPFMKKSGEKCIREDFGRLKALAEGRTPDA